MTDVASAKLVARLEQAATGFQRAGEPDWADRLHTDAQRIARGEFAGLTGLLLRFGNMGNMDDNAPVALAPLLDDIFEQARALIRTREDELALLGPAVQVAIRARLAPEYHSVAHYVTRWQSKGLPPTDDQS